MASNPVVPVRACQMPRIKHTYRSQNIHHQRTITSKSKHKKSSTISYYNSIIGGLKSENKKFHILGIYFYSGHFLLCDIMKPKVFSQQMFAAAIYPIAPYLVSNIEKKYTATAYCLIAC